VIRTGFYQPRAGAPPMVYVVGAALSAAPSTSRDAAHHRLDELAEAVQAALRAAAAAR